MDIRRYRNGKLQARGNARRPFRHACRIQKLANSAAVHYSRLPIRCPDDTATVYYNYRHYEPVTGRWMQRDPLADWSNHSLLVTYLNGESISLEQSLYRFVCNSLQRVDVGGLFPSGENDGWGDDENTSKGNCWRYACNDQVEPDKRDDEDFRKISPPGVDGTIYSCESIANGLKSKYGIDKGDASAACPKCHYKVFLALSYYGTDYIDGQVITRYRDYHWYRQDTDDLCNPTGTWSHKRGDGPVETGVVDPEKHALGIKYETKCGYFCFPCEKGKVDADK